MLASTKIQILREIDLTSQSDVGAQAIIDANSLHVLVSLLHSQDIEITRLSCSILRHISCCDQLNRHVIDAGACPPLVSLLGNLDTSIRVNAAHVMDQLSTNITCHDALVHALGGLGSNLPFAALLRHPEVDVKKSIGHILSRISRHASTQTQAHIFDGNMLVALADSLKTTDPEVVVLACHVLENISSDQPLVQAIVDTGLCSQLPSLLRHSNQQVRLAVLSAVYRMGCQVHSDSVARSVVESHALPLLIDLLRSENSDILQLELVCGVLGHIARHPISNEVSTNLPSSLAALLSSQGKPVHDAAASILWQISSRSEPGALAVVAALVELLKCTRIQAITAACTVLSAIAGEVGVVHADPCLHLISLIRHPESAVSCAALSTLHKFSNMSLDGAAVVSDAINCRAGVGNILSTLAVLLESSDVDLICRACDFLVDVSRTRYEATLTIPGHICIALLSLLRHSTVRVQLAALSTLSAIHKFSNISLEGQAAVSHAINCSADNTLPTFAIVLESSDINLLCRACHFLADVVCSNYQNKLAIPNYVGVTLASLLRHPTVMAQHAALSTLSLIGISQKRVEALVAVHGPLRTRIHNLIDLLCSPCPKVREEACNVLVNIARHDSLLPDVIDSEANPWLPLAALLRPANCGRSGGHICIALHQQAGYRCSCFQGCEGAS
ncbi:armadillo-type protein [Mycena epipterygia]|nr:armadillo-type protein [Mycena epipterygia]